MITNTYGDILETGDKLKKIYANNSLNLNSNSRINQYFLNLREINNNLDFGREKINTLFRSNPSKYYFCLYYSLELESITKALLNTKSKSAILTNKLKTLSKGTYLLSQENEADTKARDTEFELALFSFLNKNTLNSTVELKDPNPDILLRTLQYKYNIECKRPKSEESLKTAFYKAKTQHSKNTSEQENEINVIAISLEHIVFKGRDLILQVTDENEAMETLERKIISEAHRLETSKKEALQNNNFVIIYYLSCLTSFKDNSPFAYSSFVAFDIYNFEKTLSKDILEDLNKSVNV